MADILSVRRIIQMEKELLKNWIRENMIYSRGLICKKCKKEWFDKYNHQSVFDQICKYTSFLDIHSPTVPQRVWHILNDIQFVKCGNPECLNPPTFFAFTKGYLKACSNSCAQKDPATINKIKSTNLKKYGTEYGLSNKDVIEKRKKSCMIHYGVDNPTKSNEVLQKIKARNLKKFGAEWVLFDKKKKADGMLKKFGVDNNTKRLEVREQYSKDKKSVFYDKILGSDRFSSIEPLFSKEEYKGCCIDHPFMCLVCNNKFIGKIEDGKIPRCLVCFPIVGNSIFQKEVLGYIKLLIPTENIIENTKKILPSGKELDIYIPSKKLAIECNGLYCHGEFAGSKNKMYHLSKTMDCQQIGVQLIHIFEDEWKDKKEIVKSKLKHLLKLNTGQRIYARQCKIRELRVSEKRLFLEENHIQGNDVASISLGLFLKGQLVAVMTLCKSRIFTNPKNKVEGEYELSRYAALKDCSVIGGAGKLLSYFIKQNNPPKIISYADKRWSLGGLYEKLGFKKINDGTPNYWYFGRGSNYKRYHRFGFAKHTLSKRLSNFDENLTEWENMQLNGWDRIWDCGSIRYEMVL